VHLLVLGGTVFLSRAVAAEAVARGHRVTCAARGISGSVPDGAALVRVDRDEPAGLDPLAGTAFDAVVDVESMSPTRVRRALAVLGARAGHWTYVSTCSVYADHETPGQRADSAPLLDPAPDGADETDGELYGRLKLAAENAVRETLGERAFICRPGLIVGRGDRSDRLGYWPARVSAGGRFLAPGSPENQVQYVDVRDCAAWIVTAAEQRLVATLDAVCPPVRWGEWLARLTAAVGSGAEPVWVPQDFLLEHGVAPWMGPGSLPLWLPVPEYAGFMTCDVGASLAAGLHTRPLEDTVAESLGWERELGLDRERRTGITRERESELLAAWAQRGTAGGTAAG